MNRSRAAKPPRWLPRSGPLRTVEAPGRDGSCPPVAPPWLPHVAYLLLALAVLAASGLLDVQGPDRVVVPGAGITVPATCRFRQCTGLPCPGCGLTRAFVSLAHGRVRAAWSFHPSGILFFALVVFQVPYRLQQLRRLRRGQPLHRFAAADRWVLASLAVGTVVQWACRVLLI